MKTCQKLIEQLNGKKYLCHDEWVHLLSTYTKEDAKYAAKLAKNIAIEQFDKKIYFRGIIEFTNHCKCDCYYCGIRRSNQNCERYRLTEEDILECCREGYELGFRTFVLQGGEDGYFTDERLVALLHSIKANHPDCAVTLSLGERSKTSYKALKEAGADRYLLRHETCDKAHYELLHPESLSFDNRMRCLYDLKELGFQVGCGFMVGSPYQTDEHLAKELLFIKEFKPHMVGIGPFIPHRDTPFATFKEGSVEKTLLMLSLIRLMNENVLLPATTALATASEDGRIEGIKAGANVVMPNLTPGDAREKYTLYNNKAITGAESAEGIAILEKCIKKADCILDMGRGDSLVKG